MNSSLLGIDRFFHHRLFVLFFAVSHSEQLPQFDGKFRIPQAGLHVAIHTSA